MRQRLGILVTVSRAAAIAQRQQGDDLRSASNNAGRARPQRGWERIKSRYWPISAILQSWWMPV